MDYESYPEHRVGLYLWKVILPLLLFLGTVGNCLSILVLTRQKIRKSTTAAYLVVLAISDLFVLYTGLLRRWISAVFDLDIRHLHPAVCKIHMWLVYSSLDYSAWILIAVTFERVVLVWFPHSAKRRCSRRSAFGVLLAIAVFLLVFNAHLLFGNGNFNETKNNVTTMKKCSFIDPGYSNFFYNIWPWMDLSVFCIIPFFSLLVGNLLIVFKFVRGRQKIGPSSRIERTNQKRFSSMTRMLFTLNTVFLICTVPVSIYLIGYNDWEKGGDHAKAISSLFWSLCNLLMYVNNTFNFLFYCMSGRKFRDEVKVMFCNGKYSSESSNTITLSSPNDAAGVSSRENGATTVKSRNEDTKENNEVVTQPSTSSDIKEPRWKSEDKSIMEMVVQDKDTTLGTPRNVSAPGDNLKSQNKDETNSSSRDVEILNPENSVNNNNTGLTSQSPIDKATVCENLVHNNVEEFESQNKNNTTNNPTEHTVHNESNGFTSDISRNNIPMTSTSQNKRNA